MGSLCQAGESEVSENLHKAEIEKLPACGSVLLGNTAKISWGSHIRAFQLQLCTALCPEQGSSSLGWAGAASPASPRSPLLERCRKGRNPKVENEPLLKLAELLPRSFSSTYQARFAKGQTGAKGMQGIRAAIYTPVGMLGQPFPMSS